MVLEIGAIDGLCEKFALDNYHWLLYQAKFLQFVAIHLAAPLFTSFAEYVTFRSFVGRNYCGFP